MADGFCASELEGNGLMTWCFTHNGIGLQSAALPSAEIKMTGCSSTQCALPSCHPIPKAARIGSN